MAVNTTSNTASAASTAATMTASTANSLVPSIYEFSDEGWSIHLMEMNNKVEKLSSLQAMGNRIATVGASVALKQWMDTAQTGPQRAYMSMALITKLRTIVEIGAECLLVLHENFIGVENLGEHVGGMRNFEKIVGTAHYAAIMESYRQTTQRKVRDSIGLEDLWPGWEFTLGLMLFLVQDRSELIFMRLHCLAKKGFNCPEATAAVQHSCNHRKTFGGNGVSKDQPMVQVRDLDVASILLTDWKKEGTIENPITLNEYLSTVATPTKVIKPPPRAKKGLKDPEKQLKGQSKRQQKKRPEKQ